MPARTRHGTPRAARSAAVRLARALLFAAVAMALVSGIAGGLLRVGVLLPGTAGQDWLAQAAGAHAALMMCCFLGTVIAVERAVALKEALAFIAPALSALAGLALLPGQAAAGHWLLVAAATLFVLVNCEIVRRQAQAHTWLLLAAAIAWLVGNAMQAGGAVPGAVQPWWFAFLIMTIAAERLEMTRLMRRRPSARWLLLAALALLAAGAAATAASPRTGGILYGAALVLLALWLAVFDIARRTVFAAGLPRYMAICLLGGYAWLAVAGVAWAAAALGLPGRDAALHALGLGFVVSMIMGHAPVILPAIAGIKLQFGRWFYLPLALLHLSLVWRLGPGLAALAPRAQGAIFNALAIALFAATVVGAALAWRHRHGADRATAKEST